MNGSRRSHHHIWLKIGFNFWCHSRNKFVDVVVCKISFLNFCAHCCCVVNKYDAGVVAFVVKI